MTGWNERIGEVSPTFPTGANLCGLALLVGWLVAKYNGPIISETAPATLADVLFTSQASVVAIVFSLTYVGVQLTSPQYSPRLTWLFTENQHLQLTLVVVGLSLLLDTVVLVGSPLLPETWRLPTAAVMAVLAGISFAAVAEYAVRSLTLATPAGVIAAYKNRITPDNYVSNLRNTKSPRRIDENPLRGFHEFLCSQIDDGANSTWSNGFEVMTTKTGEITRSVLADHLREPSDTQAIDRSQTANLPLLQEADASLPGDASDDDTVACSSELVELADESNLSDETLFRPLLVEFLPTLACKADTVDGEAALMCLRQLRTVHEDGLEYGSRGVLRLSHEGFRTILTEESESAVSTELALISWYFALVELRETAKIDSADHNRHLAQELESYRNLLENGKKTQFYANHSVFEATLMTASRILRNTVDATGDDLDAEIHDLWSLDLDAYDARTALIIAAFRLLCSLTELVIADGGKQKTHISPDVLRGTWSSVAQSAHHLNAAPAVPFYRGLIETGFVISVVTDGDQSLDTGQSAGQMKKWQDAIEQAHHQSPDAVKEAFTRVYPESNTSRRRTATLPQPLLRLGEFKPMREHEAADRILPKLNPTTQSEEPDHHENHSNRLS